MARRRSISVPIVLSSVSVVLSITMMVMWIVVLVRNRESAETQIEGNVLMMVGGIASFIMISTVLVLFTVFLVREIREVRRQDSFIDSVTHELKSPLASVRLSLETMGRPDLDAARRDQMRDMALDDVQRLSALIDGVLAASRVGVGAKGTRKRERIRLTDAFEDALEVVARRHHLEDRVDAIFDIEVDEGLEVFGDPTSFRLVLENLVDNAIKYSGKDPAVWLRGRREAGRIVVEVTDRGIGISKADLRRIFQRFYRAPEEAVRERHGTGLGLFIVAAMVRGMGGKVEAVSDGRGKGATIRLQLPDRGAAVPQGQDA